tara:strand:- start:3249 stop:3959 length:711 start_codon:yes stop_codon:yes gene_type:complete
MGKKIIFHSIKFFDYEFKYMIDKLINCGGYIVAPAASSLSEILNKKIYYNSLRNADIAILDSGFFCVLLRIFKKEKVKKFSGYLFLKSILETNKFKNKKFFLINPNILEQNKNSNLLRTKGIFNFKSFCAPIYSLSNFRDLKLIKMINLYNPDFIIINVGGGIQEPIGAFIKQNLRKKKTAIICTGAAIGFLTKVQAPINEIYDRYYLGWLIRLLHKPKSFFPRIIQSFGLIRYFK